VKEELDIDQRKDYGLICSSSIQIGVVRGSSVPKYKSLITHVLKACVFVNLGILSAKNFQHRPEERCLQA